jgi:RNA-directed DNA polymerase
MATLLVLGPIFEVDLAPEQYAYREGRSALDAVTAVNGLIQRGYHEVVDADLSGYFDTIPHTELMKSVARRISDGRVLHLIKMWLEAAVEETDERGGKQRTTRNKEDGRGTPQGGVASPLLANVYMRRFIIGWKAHGHEARLDARIVNYADDFVICCRGTADEAMTTMRGMMGRLKLTVNEAKTRVSHLPEETFDFLGYTFGRNFHPRTGRSYLGPKPSRKTIGKITESISEATDRRGVNRSTDEVVEHLNRKLRGWSNYFRLGTVVHAYEVVMGHTRRRLRRWLAQKHKVKRGEYARFPNEYLHQELGLLQLRGTGASVPRANS